MTAQEKNPLVIAALGDSGQTVDPDRLRPFVPGGQDLTKPELIDYFFTTLAMMPLDNDTMISYIEHFDMSDLLRHNTPPAVVYTPKVMDRLIMAIVDDFAVEMETTLLWFIEKLYDVDVYRHFMQRVEIHYNNQFELLQPSAPDVMDDVVQTFIRYLAMLGERQFPYAYVLELIDQGIFDLDDVLCSYKLQVNDVTNRLDVISANDLTVTLSTLYDRLESLNEMTGNPDATVTNVVYVADIITSNIVTVTFALEHIRKQMFNTLRTNIS